MDAADKIIFNLNSKLRGLIQNTPQIAYHGKKLELYFAGDLHRAYAKMFGNVDFKAFLSSFERMTNYVIFPSSNPIYSVACCKNFMDKKMIQAIIDSKNVKTINYMLDDSSEDAGAETRNASTREQPEKNTNIFCKSMIYNEDSGSPAPASEPIKRIATIYDELESSDEMLAPSKKFKSPFATTQSKPSENAFDVLKKKIVEMFEDGYVVPVASVNAAVCQRHGMMFNYKTAECGIPKHKHKNLSRYLQCCRDIVELKTFKQAYVFLNTPTGNELIQRRITAYMVPRSDPSFMVFMEALCTSLFPIRLTVPLSDLVEIFNAVYKSDLVKHAEKRTPQAFFDDLKSPNVLVLNNNGEYSVVVTPLHSTSYKEWCGSLVHEKVFAKESKILRSGEQKAPEATVRVNVASGNVFPEARCLESIEQLLKIADMNIPKYVQEITNAAVPEEILYGPLWQFLRHNINFDDKPAFFLD